MDDLDDTIKDYRRISKEVEALPNARKFSNLKIGSLKVLGDIFESLVGAILMDTDFNYEETKHVVLNLTEKYIKHFTSIEFVRECPNYKFKEYLDQNNYKKYRLQKVQEEGIVEGKYLYQLTDKNGNIIGEPVRAVSEKDAWDVLFETRDENFKE